MQVIIKAKSHNNCHIQGTLLSSIDCNIGDIVEICTLRNSKGKPILTAQGILIQKNYKPNSFISTSLNECNVENI